MSKNSNVTYNFKSHKKTVLSELISLIYRYQLKLIVSDLVLENNSPFTECLSVNENGG